MGILDFLFQGKPPPSSTTTSSQSTVLPEWYQTYTKGLIDRANVIAGQPYTPYTGQRIAPLDDDTTKAFDLTRANVGTQQPLVDAAGKTIAAAADPFDKATFNEFVSPHTEGVVNRIAQLGNRNLTENVLPSIQDKFIAAGQRGGSRARDFTARAVRDSGDNILGRQAEALESGYNSAMGNYNSAMGRSLSAGNQLGALATLDQNLGFKDAAALEAVGGAERNYGQRNLDLGYNDFTAQRDYPKSNVGFMSSVLQGTNVPGTETKTSNAPSSVYQPSGLAQIAGGAAGIGGALDLLNKTNIPKLFGFKKGGRVRSRRPVRGALDLAA